MLKPAHWVDSFSLNALPPFPCPRCGSTLSARSKAFICDHGVRMDVPSVKQTPSGGARQGSVHRNVIVDVRKLVRRKLFTSPRMLRQGCDIEDREELSE